MANPDFSPLLSSDDICRGQDITRCISDDFNAIESDIDDLEAAVNSFGTTYAAANHTHTGYALATDVTALQDAISTKANTNHTHTEYATSSHTHDNYVTTNDFDELSDAVDGKADSTHTHTGYAATNHSHSEYAAANHTHSDYAASNHTHSNYATVSDLASLSDEVDGKADSTHTHTGYAATNHTHDNYAASNHSHTEYAAASHAHDDRYYTESEVDSKLSAKSDTSHTHVIDSSLSDTSTNPVQNKVVKAAIDDKVPVTRTVNGKALSANISLTASDVGADASGAASSALTSANAYTDSKIDAIVGSGASTTLDTIGEISAAIEDNQDAIDILNAAIANKANTSNLTSHTGNSTIHITATERTNWNSAKTHADTAHAPSNAEVNQNAFSNVIVGSTTITADTKTDTLTFAGSNVTLTPDATNGKITIGITKSNVTSALGYTPPTTNTTYSVATQSANGLMSSADKTKLDDIATGANNYTLPSAGSFLGGVKTGGDVSISNGIITVNDDSHNHVIANVDGLQTALDGKSGTSHNHNSSYISKDLQITADNGEVEYSYLKTDNKNILTEIMSYPVGIHTVYSQSGSTGNPKSTEAWRIIAHKTSSTVCWVQAYGSIGSVYTNYHDGSNGWRGWRCLWDNDPDPLWSGAMYMSSSNSTPQTVTPSKKLSECQHGWLLLWSDYDPGDGANDADFVTTMIPKNNPSGGKWGGKSFLCDIPRYVGSDPNDVDTERRIIKPIYVHDDCIKGSYQNAYDERNDVVLRAVYEY